MNKDEPTIIDSFGNKYWLNNKGQYHRLDGPAIELANGSKHWCLNGQFHRLDGPAIESVNGEKQWRVNGELHRVDGPAYEGAGGTKEWYLEGVEYTEEEFNLKVTEMNKDKPTKIDKDGNKYWKNAEGKLHRIDGPAREYADGSKAWWVNGKLHRLDGPAYEGSNRHKSWYIDGQLHREDGPAIEYPNGSKEWFVNGQRHREDGPAVEYPNGYKEWYVSGKEYSGEEFKIKVAEMNKNKPTRIDKDGNKIWENDKEQLHREDGPAFEKPDKTKYWYLNGKPHREDGPAIEYPNGYKEWWIHGLLHRLDGPAIEWADGSKHWFVNGQCHRLDGPAVEWANGTKQWYLEGKEYTEEEFNLKVTQMNKDKPTEIDKDGNKIWRNDKDLLHREDGPAIERADGSKSWYINGLPHRTDGPAIEYVDGSKTWYLNGKKHRLDGPAREVSNGRCNKYYINGKKYSAVNFVKYLQENNLSIPIKLKRYINKNIIEKDKPTTIDKNGNKYWNNDKGQFHRLDGPACEYSNGDKEWWINGKRHRTDGPAREWSDGSKGWFIEGIKYSEKDFKLKIAGKNKNKPTEIDSCGNKYWRNDKWLLHREDGPAFEGANGYKEWYVSGQCHREDGPACEYSNGDKIWYFNGKLHRLDGPAREWSDGSKGWFIEGIKYSKKDFKIKVSEMNKDKPTTIDKDGNKYWKNDKGLLHREDGPAYEGAGGTKEWWVNGQLHREEGPAIEHANGTKEWYLNNKHHREDGPAIERADGSKAWYINGKEYNEEEFKLKIAEMNKNKPTEVDEDGTKYWKNDKGEFHRLDGPAVERADGNKSWYLNGKKHRENGPACEYASGSKYWYLNGKLHREDGPAYEDADGYKEWWVNGVKYSEEYPKILGVVGVIPEKQMMSQNKKEKMVMNKFSVTYYGPNKINFGLYNYIVYNGSLFKLYLNGVLKDKPTKNIEDLYSILKKELKDYTYESKPRDFIVEVTPNRISYFAKSNNTNYSLGFISKVNDEFIVYDQFDEEISRNKSLESAVNDFFELCSGVKFFRLDRKMFNYHGLISETLSTDGNILQFEKYIKTIPTNADLKSDITTTDTIMKWDLPSIDNDALNKGYIGVSDIIPINVSLNSNSGSFNDLDLKMLNESLKQMSNKIDQIASDVKVIPKTTATSNISEVKNFIESINSSQKEDLEYYIKPDFDIIGDIPYVPNIDISELSLPYSEDSVEEKNCSEHLESEKPKTTYEIGISSLEDSLKKSAARQSSRILKDLIKIMLKTSADKIGQNDIMKILDTEFSDAVIELIAPSFIHMICQRTDIPYKEQIEMICKLAIEANITHYTFKYSDKSVDFMKNILTDSAFRDKLKNAVKIGGAIINSESGSDNDLSSILEKESSLNLESILEEALV